MLKSRMHSIFRDPAWWVFIVSFIVLLYAILAQDVKGGDGLYTLSYLQKLGRNPGALEYFNQRFGTAYESLDAFFSEFVPSYLDAASEKIIPAIAANANANAFVWLFPMFFITRRFQKIFVYPSLYCGVGKTGIFFNCVLEFVALTYFILDMVAILVAAPFIGVWEVPPLLLFQLLVLRPLLFLAWCAPMVIISFASSNMLTAGLFSFGAVTVQTILGLYHLIPYVTPLYASSMASWTADQIHFPLCWLIAIGFILASIVISYFIFRFRDITHD